MRPRARWLVCLAVGVLLATTERGLAMEDQAPKALVVAAVQMRNLDHNYEQSRALAERMVAEAAGRGARLVVLPEFALIGYRFHPDLWPLAEPLEGPTVAWMRELCRRHQIYLATCILEVRDQDFYDTLVLVGPGEGELWAHRKIEPAILEAYFFRGGGINPAVFDTPLGRIGFAICFDTSKTHTVRNLLAERPDLLVMVFSAPKTPIVPKKMQQETIDAQSRTPGIYAEILGVPVISCNKTGPFASPFPGIPGLRLRSGFSARSRIVAADGKILAALEEEEAVIVAEVVLAKGEPHPEKVPADRWLFPYSRAVRLFSDLALKTGGRSYRRSAARKAAVEQAKARSE